MCPRWPLQLPPHFPDLFYSLSILAHLLFSSCQCIERLISGPPAARPEDPSLHILLNISASLSWMTTPPFTNSPHFVSMKLCSPVFFPALLSFSWFSLLTHPLPLVLLTLTLLLSLRLVRDTLLYLTQCPLYSSLSS